MSNEVPTAPNVASCFINGYDRFTEQARFYMCIAACSSAPAEAVHLMLLRDDRFLRFAEKMRSEMVRYVSEICSYPELIWRRLHDIVGKDWERSWQHLCSECIRSALIGAAYLEMNGFSIVGVSPWMYTQGHIREHIERIRATSVDELPADETTRKIAVGLANGVQPGVFVEALLLLRDASMTANVDERAHGYGACAKTMLAMGTTSWQAGRL
jgi:hypothetical protein